MRGRGMAVEEAELRAAKRGYREALVEGNREEEARWANVVGDLFKRRGEYVEALKWLRIDYDISSKHLPARHLLPTCQSLGELLLRLDRFNDALVFQKKHLELAKDSDNLIEQQRATTQLGRTYHEIFLRSEHDHCAIRNAKKYFKSAMKLVRKLRENDTGEKSSFFLKEYIDAHNNIGMLDIDLDNLEEAEKILLKGLKICDEEEVVEDDDGRSRLHHNLGRLYVELREWGKARVHIEKDILICKRIGHPQGEAKGFINFGELHYKVQEYDEAIRCYQKALSIVKCLEDEDALVDQINQNMEIVKEARNVLEELKKDEQKLKKLMRTTCDARGTSNERKCLSDQLKCLDSLIEKCRSMFAWPRHREFAKRKKRVASELCDKEKLGDSYLCIGESYQKLRNFSKARKWYMKGWNVYRSIGNLEGQALTKINIGEVLDSSGDWDGALQAFENGYRLAVEANRRFVQLSALENMHYSHMIRFDNMKEARKLQNEIQNLKFLLKEEGTSKSFENDYCSETETDGDDLSESASSAEKIDDDAPLASLICPSKKNPAKSKLSQLDSHGTKSNIPCNLAKEVSYKDLSKTQQSIGRKRVRVVISDDEAEELDEVDQLRRVHRSHVEDVATSNKDSRQDEQSGINEVQDATHPNDSKDVLSSCTPIHVEESTSSFKSKSPQFTADNGMEFIASGSKLDNVHVSGSPLQSNHGAGFNAEDENAQSITCKIGNDVVFVDLHSCMYGDYLDVESVKVEVACMYYLQLSEKKSRGLLPLIGHIKYCGKALGSLEAIDDLKHFVCGKVWIEVVIDGWVQKRLMKLYIDYCKKLSEAPYMKLLKKLYNLEVSEDEVIASDCGLQDISISPFLNALQAHKAVAILDISHNLLGNETVEKLQQIFTSSSQKYGGLTLDLHCNRFGPTSLFQICESPIMLARLEVLDLSENRLTDASSSYLSTILENCKALYSLNIEQCSITSRTIQKVAEALHDGSVLSRLFIGKNNPISGNAMASLLSKLTSMKRFSELSLCGIRLNKPVLDHLCQLARTPNLSALLLGGTCIGVDGAARLTEALLSGPQELVKLDLSYCGLTSHDFTRTLTNITLLGGILELNLGGNSISQEGCDALRSVLVDPECSLKSVILNKCHLGLAGILQIVQALSGNESLEELHLAENADILQERTLQYNATTSGGLATACEKSNGTDTGNNVCAMNAECNNLEVADSDNEMLKGLAVSGPDGSCASSSMRSTYVGSQLIQELCDAIGLANHVQLLNLSKNGLPPEVVEALYSSWSSSSRSGGLARKHVAKDQTVHFWVDGRRCCGMKPCCRRD